MKKLLFILSAFLIISLASYAQSERPQRERQPQRQGQGQTQRVTFAERQAKLLEGMKKTLALTKEQTTKIETINKAYDAKMTALREKASTQEDRQAMRTDMRKMMEAYDTDVKAVLTPEQKVSYEKMQEKRRQDQASQRGNRERGENGNRGNNGQRGNRQ